MAPRRNSPTSNMIKPVLHGDEFDLIDGDSRSTIFLPPQEPAFCGTWTTVNEFSTLGETKIGPKRSKAHPITSAEKKEI
jgi:hypothetical protein